MLAILKAIFLSIIFAYLITRIWGQLSTRNDNEYQNNTSNKIHLIKTQFVNPLLVEKSDG